METSTQVRAHKDMMKKEIPKVSILQSMKQGEEIGETPSKDAQVAEGKDTMAKVLEQEGDNASTITTTTDNVSPKSIHSISFA